MSVIIDLNFVCIVCLQDGGELRSIFDQDEETPTLKISEKISQCSDLQLQTDNKSFPSQICASCVNDLDVTWRFRRNCETAYSVFRSLQEHDEVANVVEELEQHKIKLPDGLKIKRIKPETKTYLLPVEQAIFEENSSPIGIEETEAVEYVAEEDQELEETTPTIKNEMGNIIFEDYYTNDDDDELLIDDEEIEVKASEQSSNNNTIEEAEENQDLPTTEQPQKINTTTRKNEAPKVKVKQKKNAVNTPKEVHQSETSQMKLRVRRFATSCEDVSTKKHATQNKKAAVKTTLLVQQKAEKENVKKEEKVKKEKIHKDVIEKAILRRKVTSVTRKRKSSSDARPPKICEICGNSYKYQHALNAHMRRHYNDRPFACEFCDKAFVSAVELRRHMRVHTGHKPYSCQYCDRRFSDFGSRIKHERTHTGERPFRCNTCGKSFAYSHVLSVHTRTHTGEKKFQCTRCGKGFTKKAYLQTHMEQHARFVDVSDDVEMLKDAEHTQQQQNVAVEECIFTTDYIIEDSLTDDNVKEEHLDDAESEEYVISMR